MTRHDTTTIIWLELRPVARAADCTIRALASGRAFFAATETTVTELAPGVFFRKTQTEPEFIAATNQKLAELVRVRKFREDLYFRLNVITLEFTPLRDRGEDIIMLAFILSPSGDDSPMFSLDLPLPEATKRFQIEYIKKHIERSRGSMTEAAERLGLHRSNLYRKMKQLGMPTTDHDDEELGSFYELLITRNDGQRFSVDALQNNLASSTPLHVGNCIRLGVFLLLTVLPFPWVWIRPHGARYVTVQDETPPPREA
jgi:hypothetical protein